MSLRTSMRLLAASAGFALSALSAHASTPPVDVSYSVTGSSGDWTLDFTVANNLTGTAQQVYFFGVQLDARGIVASPTGYSPDSWTSWSNESYGGSTTVYNNNWIGDGSALTPGIALGGFEVHSTDVDAPTSIAWFAYGAYGSPYTGGGNFNSTSNPGFEGVTGAVQAVPEPETYALMLGGLLALGAFAKRRQAAG